MTIGGIERALFADPGLGLLNFTTRVNSVSTSNVPAVSKLCNVRPDGKYPGAPFEVKCCRKSSSWKTFQHIPVAEVVVVVHVCFYVPVTVDLARLVEIHHRRHHRLK